MNNTFPLIRSRQHSTFAVVLSLIMLATQFGLPQQQAVNGQMQTDEAYEAIQSAADAHVAHLDRAYDAVIVQHSIYGSWAYGQIAYKYSGTAEFVPNEPLVVLAHYGEDHTWQALVPSSRTAQTYNLWLSEVPTQLIPNDSKLVLRLPETNRNEQIKVPVTGYYLPWAGGWGATVTNWPSDHNYFAWDFNLWRGQWQGTRWETGFIAAAKDGVVIFAKDVTSDTLHCAGCANVVIMRHSANEYSWYYHLQQDSIPAEIKTARREGTQIKAGTIIGMEGNSGVSTGVHLHFMVTDGVPDLGQYDETDHDSAPWPNDNTKLDVDFEDWDEQSTDPYSNNYIDSTNSVILYWDADYKGPSARFTCNDAGVQRNVPSFLNHQASSIRVTPQGDFFVALYSDIRSDPALGGYCRGWWWTEANFDNDYCDPKEIPDPQRLMNDAISSLKMTNKQEYCSHFGSRSSSSRATAFELLPQDDRGDFCGTPPTDDNATFVSDITLPDGSVVSPGQSLHKVWRVRNSGTSTWSSNYQLAFVGGDQMGAPSTISVPGSVPPGNTADLAVDMTAPSNPGNYAGHWRLRNPQGVYFGDELWIQIQVGVNSSNITLSFDPVSPSNATHVFIEAEAHNMGDVRAMRILIDGQIVSELGAPEVNADWSTIPYADGLHSIVAQAARWDDPAWAHAEQTSAIYELLPGRGPVNHGPYPPSLVSPPDYYVSDFGSPTLVAQHNGDPEGDPVTEYFFEIFDSPQNPSSGWTANNSWTPPGLDLYGYKWRVKVRDSGGAESGWSETRHFLIEDPGPIIYDFHWEWCRPSWGGTEKICFCADTNAGTLRVQVNMATDGSENGEWRIINELGVPQYMCSSDDDRPPNWDQLEAEAGVHLARLYARREGGWEAAATADILIDLSPERRPSNPTGRSPAWEGYVSSQAVHFSWLDSLRTNDYHLLAGTNPDPSQNPLLDVTLPVGTTEYDFAFADDYPTIYWRVTANGPYGTNEANSQFHVDIDAPATAVSALDPVTTDTTFPVSWGGSDNRSGIRWYDVQYRDGERGEWVMWMEHTTLTGALFQGQAGHTYYFRCRAMDEIGNWEVYPSDDGDTYTLVDPSALPPGAWWDSAYALKRNIVILNNDAHPMPAHYPVRLYFDNTTTPTAQELYDASLSAIKGDDLRLVYADTTELNRQIQIFSPSEVRIWFPLSAEIPGNQSSTGEYQLYYANSGSVNPPIDVNQIFVPVADANTVGLWHFQEGAGSTVHDASGRGHDGSFVSPGWTIEGKHGNAGVLDGASSLVNFGHPSDFDVGQVTMEGWINLRSHPGNHPGVIVKDQAYYLELDGRILYFTAQRPGGGCGLNAGQELPLNTWTHFAAVYDGNNQYIYLNGQLSSSRDCPGTLSISTQDLIAGYIGRPAYLPGNLQHLRVSNVARTSFPYALVVETPSVQVGSPILPPGSGAPDLVLQSLSTYRSEYGGIIVQAVVRNEGDATTTNGFYNDLYADHVPDGPGDLSGSVRFWIASPVAAGATITLTAVVTDVQGMGILANVQPLSELTTTLYTQADSEGVVTEPDDGNNISAGSNVCMATADAFESDDTPETATPISLGSIQVHNFDALSDHDWLRLDALAGIPYTIRTFDLGGSADTYIYLYDTDSATLLAANDDYGGTLASRIDWTAPDNGSYYILVKHWNPGAAGCGTTYSVSAGSYTRVYLPLVVKTFHYVPPTPTPTPPPTPAPNYFQRGSVIGSGGTGASKLQSTSYRMTGTLGQPAVNQTIGSSNYFISTGFWGGAGTTP